MTTEDGARPDAGAGAPASRSRPPDPGSRAAVLVIGGPVAPGDIPRLCDRAGAILGGCGPGPVVCDVAALGPDAAAVEAMARLQLTARRLGRAIVFRHACEELGDLLAFVGLADAVPCGVDLALEVGGEAEQREQALGVEEERDPGDPVA